MSENLPLTCAPNEDPDQPAHSSSLIKICIEQLKDSQGHEPPHADIEDADQTANGHSDPSPRWAHTRTLYVNTYVKCVPLRWYMATIR